MTEGIEGIDKNNFYQKQDKQDSFSYLGSFSEPPIS